MAVKDPIKTQLAFEKKRTALKGYCLGRDYVDVLRAITFAEEHHTGVRKDGVTPEFQHQIEIALHATTLKGLSNADESILLQMIMLHDVVEDYNVSLVEIDLRFGPVVAKGVEALSKIINGVKKPMVQYMRDLALNPLAALAKGCDRVHNVQSMRGVFNYEKQKSYAKEVREHFFPMLRRVRDLSPQYRQAINNIKNMLEAQVQWVEYLHESLATSLQAVNEGVSHEANPVPNSVAPQANISAPPASVAQSLGM